MKTYEINKDLIRIRKYFDVSQTEFASLINSSRASVARYEAGTNIPDNGVLENIYAYAYRNDLFLNKAKVNFAEEEKSGILLFHGTNATITREIDTKHSIAPNDFGDGFYAGEKYEQAITWVAEKNNSSVYMFSLRDAEDLDRLDFKVDRDWMYAILYFRGAFKGVAVPEEVVRLINRINKCDYLVAPIADNQMYQTLNRFANNEITDEACCHALSATNLGRQYVFKSEKACKHLECLERLYLCKAEKEYYTTVKAKDAKQSQSKADLAIIEYRRRGKYFDEIFKRS